MFKLSLKYIILILRNTSGMKCFQKMADFIMIELNADKAVQITDRHSNGYSEPITDRLQSVFDIETKYIDGILVAKFKRPIILAVNLYFWIHVKSSANTIVSVLRTTRKMLTMWI